MMDRRKTFQLAANNLLLDTKKLNTKPEGIVVGSPLKGKLIKKRVISHYDSSKFSPLIGSPTLAVKGSAYRQMDASPSARFFPTYEPDMVRRITGEEMNKRLKVDESKVDREDLRSEEMHW
eukprot:TRINITY_DN4481_c0_g2_i1.p1 TRINITY_DN4481_c0_g2~~TRINITY_DN4481_c0_g2_i1.p1  ORF type:complete len:121 (-),score=14.98 TRINITY_DN4481_c0_g2_i1:446-808(-)